MSIFTDIKAEVSQRCVSNGLAANEAFCEIITEKLKDAGVIDEFSPCHFDQTIDGRRIKIDGYAISDDLSKLELFISSYDSDAEDFSVKKIEIKKIRQLQKLADEFYQYALLIRSNSYNEESELFEIINYIKQSAKKLEFLRVHILGDGYYTENYNVYSSNRKGMGYTYTCELWDANSLKTVFSDEGFVENNIEIDVNKFSKAIPCFKTSSDKSIETYLASFPGDFIAEIYNKYEVRLMENNVRVFLQSTGKVNKGIKKTIAEEPEKFISYNNGLSVTVSDIEFNEKDKNRDFYTISKLIGLQIVNGGQTTATIRESYYKDEEVENVRKLNVPVKINLIKQKDEKDALISFISRYANTQNGIKNTDIQSNNSYHIQMEGKSREIRGPFGYWFYERLRGGYNLAASKSSSPKEFKKNNPKTRLLTKEYVSLMYYCLKGLPYLSVKGPQNLSMEFLKDISKDFKKRGELTVPSDHFIKIVSAYILFQACMKIQKEIGIKTGRKIETINQYNPFASYYTVSYIFNHSRYIFNYNYLFDAGEISEDLTSNLQIWISKIRESMLSGAESIKSDYREYFKKDTCWENVKKLKLAFIDKKTKEFEKEEVKTPKADSPVDKCMEIKKSVWQRMINYLVEKNNKKKSVNFERDFAVCKNMYDLAAKNWKKKPPESIAILAIRVFDSYSSESEIDL